MEQLCVSGYRISSTFVESTSLVMYPSLLISYRLKAHRSFSVTEPLSKTDSPITKSCERKNLIYCWVLKGKAHDVLVLDNLWKKKKCIDDTSNRMEPLLSMSKALNRKCAYMVASENITKWCITIFYEIEMCICCAVPPCGKNCE